MNIGVNLKKRRKEMDLTQKQLAKMSGISLMSIQRYERNERSPRYDALIKLAELLECSINTLVTGREYVIAPHIDEEAEGAMVELNYEIEMTEKKLLGHDDDLNNLIYLKGFYNGLKTALDIMEDAYDI